jgi:hypothetical protein
VRQLAARGRRRMRADRAAPHAYVGVALVVAPAQQAHDLELQQRSAGHVGVPEGARDLLDGHLAALVRVLEVVGDPDHRARACVCAREITMRSCGRSRLT